MREYEIHLTRAELGALSWAALPVTPPRPSPGAEGIFGGDAFKKKPNSRYQPPDKLLLRISPAKSAKVSFILTMLSSREFIATRSSLVS